MAGLITVTGLPNAYEEAIWGVTSWFWPPK